MFLVSITTSISIALILTTRQLNNYQRRFKLYALQHCT